MAVPNPAQYNLLNASPVYKPFLYPWAYDAWLMQQRLHWLPEEVPLADDVKDWHKVLTPAERNLVTHLFRFFTQGDCEVENAYIDHYGPRFKPIEVRMMLSAFSNIETVHIAAYSHLLETIKMPEVEYSAFLRYDQMRNKHEFLKAFKMNDHFNTALSMAVFAAFTEGLQLFASFAVLMNFPRFNKMKGMGQIVTWSIRDETIHVLSIMRLFFTYLDEFGHEIDIPLLNEAIKDACRQVVQNEFLFIDLMFEMGSVEGMSAQDTKNYVMFIADRRLVQLGLEPIYNIKSNPIPWLDDMMNAIEHTNFFENRATEYSKASSRGTWEEAFEVSIIGGANNRDNGAKLIK